MGLVLLLAAGLVLALGLQTWLVARTLTRPPRRGYTWAVSRNLPGTPAELPPPPAGPGPRGFRDFTFTSRGLALAAWDIPGDAPGGPTVVFTHGWGESRLHGLPRLPTLLPLAGRVVLWDLPAHGESRGTLAMGTREVEDLLTLLATLPPERPVVLHGFSLGAGVSIAAAAAPADPAAPPITAVIAEAPYRFPQTPARNVVAGAGMPAWPAVPVALGMIGWLRLRAGWGWFARRGPASFDRSALAAGVRAPLLVLHGLDDTVCTLEDARHIAAAAPHGRLVELPGAGHLDAWTNPLSRPHASRTVTEFLDRLNRP